MKRRLILSCLALVTLGLGACKSSPKALDYTRVIARFFLEVQGSDGTLIQLPLSGVQIFVNPKPVLTEGDIVSVELVQVDLGKCLMFQMTSSAARDFYRLSTTNQGRRLVLTLDGVAAGARRIDGAIANGIVYVFVERPDDSLVTLVDNLKRTSSAVQKEIARKG